MQLSPESPGLRPLRLNSAVPFLSSVTVTEAEVNWLFGFVVVSVNADREDCHTTPMLSRSPTTVPTRTRGPRRALVTKLVIALPNLRRVCVPRQHRPWTVVPERPVGRRRLRPG